MVTTRNSVQFSCSVVSDSLRPHRLQHAVSWTDWKSYRSYNACFWLLLTSIFTSVPSWMVFCPHQPCTFLCHWISYREEVCFLLTGILNSIKADLVLLKNLTLITGTVGILTKNEPCCCHMCTERNQLLKQAGQYCFRCKISNQVDSSWGCTVWSIYNQVWCMVIWNSTDRTGNKGQSAISRWACIHVPGVYGGEAFFFLFVYLFSFFLPSLPLSLWH